jgi:hypothetical protein
MNPVQFKPSETPFWCIHALFYFQHHFILKVQKHIYFLAHTTKTQKHHYRNIIILLHCYLLYRIAYHILFLLTFTPCAWQPLGGVGDTRQGDFFASCFKKDEHSFFTVPREFDIKPRVLSWGKFTLATTLYTWSPDELTPLLCVINHPKFSSNCIKTTWIHHLDLGVSDSSLGLHLLRIGLRLDLFKRDLALLGLSELLPLGFFELMLLLNQCQFAFHKYW